MTAVTDTEDIEYDLGPDHRGRMYRGPFFAAEDPAKGPGWYVFGRSLDDYKPNGIIRIVARPNVKPRVHPHYNVRVRRGWLKKRDAQAVADQMNKDLRS